MRGSRSFSQSASEACTWTSIPTRSRSVHGPIGQPAPFVIAASSASGVTRASSIARTQSLRSGIRIRFTTKPGVSWQGTETLPSRSLRLRVVFHSPADSHVEYDDLDERHQRRRVEEVHAHDTLGRGRRGGDLRHGERGRVRRKHRVGPARPLELREEVALRAELLDDRLDHEVAVRERGELGGRLEPGDRRIPFFLRSLTLLDLTGEEVADPCRRGLAEVGGHLATDDVEPRLHRDLRDARSHRAEPDNADPLHVHGGVT